MKVSLITVSFNSAETIEDCIRSVLSQDYPDIEYIIIDGASKDGTIELIEKFRDRIAQLVSEPDKGIYHAMNKGIDLCTGEIVGVINSDDMYADEKVISDVVRTMQESKTDSCYGDLVYVDPLDTSRVVRRWNSGGFDKKKFLKGWMPPHPTFFLRRHCYEKFGKFNLSFKTSADYELMLRMLYKEGLSTAYLNRVMVHMRTGGQSNLSLKNRIKANREDRLAWKVNDLKPGFFTTIRKPLSKLTQFLKRH